MEQKLIQLPRQPWLQPKRIAASKSTKQNHHGPCIGQGIRLPCYYLAAFQTLPVSEPSSQILHMTTLDVGHPKPVKVLYTLPYFSSNVVEGEYFWGT